MYLLWENWKHGRHCRPIKLRFRGRAAYWSGRNPQLLISWHLYFTNLTYCPATLLWYLALRCLSALRATCQYYRMYDFLLNRKQQQLLELPDSKHLLLLEISPAQQCPISDFLLLCYQYYESLLQTRPQWLA